MANKNSGSIGSLFATSSNTGQRIGLHVIEIDSSGLSNPNAARLDAISSVLGTVDDAAITSGSSGTLSGKARGALTIQADVWDSANNRVKVSVTNSPTVSPVAGSTWNVRPLQSSAADLQMTATPAAGSTWNVRPLQSSAADLQMTATPAAGSTWNVRPLQSSAADLQMTATPAAGSTWFTQPGSTNWASSAGFHFDSSGGLLISTGPILISFESALQSTAAPSSGTRGVIVREVVDSIFTFTSSNAFTSTLAAINSTAAGLKCKVFAYSLTSTDTTSRKITFYAGSTLVWTVVLQAVSSAISGANLAVSPPAYLFTSDAGSSMTIRTPSSFAGCKVSVAYQMQP